MDDRTKIILVRLACGTAILITSIVCKVNGTVQGIALFLMGVPFEYASSTKEKD